MILQYWDKAFGEYFTLPFEGSKKTKRYLDLRKTLTQFVMFDPMVERANVLEFSDHYKKTSACYNSLATCIERYFLGKLAIKKSGNNITLIRLK